MEYKPWYPSDYTQALNNILTEDETTTLLNQPGASPRFVYDPLVLPTVLKYFTDMPQTTPIARNMTQATLFGYQLYHFSNPGMPVIAPSPDPQAAVEGLLVFGLNEQQRNAIYELEAGLMKLVSVQVDIQQRVPGERQVCSVRAVEAGAFCWADEGGSLEGLVPIEGAAWSLDEFLVGSFYEHIARSQCKGMVGVEGVLPHRSSGKRRSRSYTGQIETLECIEEDHGEWLL
ncbi:hypothetical protein SI65_04418 [Aspergillus cristatus]|uniref:Gamma-glutamylcyclotransferase AIG2-like domain-containing protein n=1 Tax=Aspergillus cristatus TaxID=573508 RepID=A0A1E3BEQ2_ASPCR|nr:hypothetical protein SI65_04418 [Aspergillus cristatus]